MSNAAALLRMLEPAVRPAGLPGPVHSPRGPIESRSFESLLEEARDMRVGEHIDQDVDATVASTESAIARETGLIGQLGQIGQIQNDSLRSLMETHERTVIARAGLDTTNRPKNL